uniref:N-alpha-acetyltransferase 60 n=1 Tax=Timema douglasi TaxID=61478 RepID=A0A7R8VH26_TIMDO|nr:unnamed protein product [Timema douglasi]
MDPVESSLPTTICDVSATTDRGILSQAFNKQTELGYILSLGVSKEQRRNGIASLLLDNLIAHLTTVDHVDCKALFLHVLTTNSAAIHFYEHRNFSSIQPLQQQQQQQQQQQNKSKSQQQQDYSHS